MVVDVAAVVPEDLGMSEVEMEKTEYKRTHQTRSGEGPVVSGV